MSDSSPVNTISGRNAFIHTLLNEGITRMFGNPGTTELPIMHALADYPEMGYVLAMQESVVIGIADGFSRASGELVACNVHVAHRPRQCHGCHLHLQDRRHADDRDRRPAGNWPRADRTAAL